MTRWVVVCVSEKDEEEEKKLSGVLVQSGGKEG
jgi:hypothetical protein